MKLKGKTAIVIGASGGIGRELCLALAKEGVNLILVARRKIVLSSLKDKVTALGVNAAPFSCDIMKPDSIDSLTKKVKKSNKVVDIFIHSAGIGVYKPLEEVSLDEWNESMAVNVDSVFYLAQKLMPLLKKSEKAYVIATGSGMGKVALSGRSVYCSSKFALRGLMLSLAKEYKNTKIKFIHLTLGSVLTAFGPLSFKDKERKYKKGKGYLDPSWLANNIVTRIKNDTLEPETPVYPRHYFLESKKDKR
jgi:short-subunit dehydrogenase